MRRLRNRPILEVAARAVLALDDSATQLARDLERAIGRTRVGDQHFVSHLLRTGDARRDILALVLARNDDGELRWTSARVSVREPTKR